MVGQEIEYLKEQLASCQRRLDIANDWIRTSKVQLRQVNKPSDLISGVQAPGWENFKKEQERLLENYPADSEKDTRDTKE